VEFPQLPEVVEALLRLPQQSVNVSRPSQILCVDSQVLLTLSTAVPLIHSGVYVH